MKYSDLVDRIAPEAASKQDPWAVHTLASKKAAAGQDIVMLSIGQEVDETTPLLVVNEAVASLHAGNHHYTEERGSEALRQSIARYHSSMTGQSVSADQCIVYAGAQNSLYALAQVLLQPGDSVIISEPYYTTYAATFSSSGAELIKVPVTKANAYQLDVDAIASHIKPSTRAIVLNSPNNPMGTFYSLDEYTAIMALCEQYDLWLVLDAVYLDIVDRSVIDLPHQLSAANERLVTVGSLSKSHRMTGWRLGWVVGPESLVQHLTRLSTCMHYGLAPFIMEAGIVAIDQASETPQIVRETIERRRRIAYPILNNITEAELIDSGQGMFMLLDVTRLQVSALDFALHLLEGYNVAVLPCDGFGETGENLVRIGLCVDDQKIKSACEQIVACVKEIAASQTDEAVN